MEKNKKNYFGILLFIFALSVLSVSVFRFYVEKDFTTYDFFPCDPISNSCFVKVCEEGDPRCEPFASEERNFFFSVVEKTKQGKQFYQCNEANLALLSDLVFDASCSE